MKSSSLLFYAAIFATLSGCSSSFDSYEIKTPYKPALQRLNVTERVDVFTQVTFQPVFGTDRRMVGVGKGSSGSEGARICLPQDAGLWIKDAFDRELEAVGLNPVSTRTDKSVRVGLNVQQFFVEPWVGFWSADLISILKIEARVELPFRDSIFSRRFVTYDITKATTWTIDMYETRILNVSQKGISEIASEIRRLIYEKKGA